MLPKISLMEAYLIETLRNHHVSDEELLTRVVTGNIGDWENLDSSFDFTGLIDLYRQDKQVYSSIIQNGYQVKFVTFGGLKNLLKLKFDKHADRNYQLLEDGVTGLKLTPYQYEKLKQVLSQNWRILVIQEHDSQQVEVSVRLI